MSSLTLRITRRAVRLHNRAKRMGGLGYIYTWICRIISFLRNRLLILLWNIFKWRPRLNRRTAEAFVSGAAEIDRAKATRNPKIDGRLVVRIAFHFNGRRLTYLVEMLRQLRELPFRQVYIAVDTNSKKSGESLRAANVDFVDEMVIHTELATPYNLTWMHRGPLKAAINDFDYFMYAEDDLLITPVSIELWCDRLSALKAHGFLPGFLRVEQNREGQLVSSDFHKPAGRGNIVSIAGKPYLWTPYPYQAFWIYDKATMKEFIESPFLRRVIRATTFVREWRSDSITRRMATAGTRSTYCRSPTRGLLTPGVSYFTCLRTTVARSFPTVTAWGPSPLQI